MRNEMGIVFLISVLVLAFGFLFFSSGDFGITGEVVGLGNLRITGQVVLNDSEAEVFLGGKEIINVSREEVVQRVSEVEDIIEEMRDNNFSVVYVEDRFVEAERVFQQVEYAEMLKGRVEASEVQRSEARLALALIDWRNLDYSNVLIYLEDIGNRRDRAFEIFDGIGIVSKNVEKYDAFNMSEAYGFLDEARNAFYEDRYDDAEVFLDKARVSVDLKSSEASVLGGLKRGVTGFFQKYWVYVLLALVLLSVAGVIFYRNVQRYFLKRKIFRMKLESRILVGLMKKTQMSRFKENKISGLVYSIRMKKYEEKLAGIKRMLPVLERRMADSKW